MLRTDLLKWATKQSKQVMSGYPLVAALMCVEGHDALISNIDGFIDTLHKLLRVRCSAAPGWLLCRWRAACRAVGAPGSGGDMAVHALCGSVASARVERLPMRRANGAASAGPQGRQHGSAVPGARDHLLHPAHGAQERHGCACLRARSGLGWRLGGG